MIKSEMIYNLPSANGLKAAAATVPGMIVTKENMRSKNVGISQKGIELGV